MKEPENFKQNNQSQNLSQQQSSDELMRHENQLSHPKKDIFFQKDLSSYKQIKDTIYLINQNEILQQGTEDNVYLGFNTLTKMDVSIRVIDNLSKQSIQQIQKSIQNLKTLNHPNFLKYYDFHQDQIKAYIFTEYCSRGSLKQYRKKCVSLNEIQIFKILNSIIEAMIYVNDKGYIDRDLNHKNIQINEDQEVRIAGISIDRILYFEKNKNLQKFISLWPTPEQILSTNSDKNTLRNNNSCVQGCGMLAYYLHAGKTIFDDYKMRKKRGHQFGKFQLIQSFPDLSNINNLMSKQMKLLIKQMLIKDVERRPSLEDIQNNINYKNLCQKYILPYTIKRNQQEQPEFSQKLWQEFNIIKEYIRYKSKALKFFLLLKYKLVHVQFHLLRNIQKLMLIYLTLSLYLIKASEYQNWLSNSIQSKSSKYHQINLFKKKLSLSDFSDDYQLFLEELFVNEIKIIKEDISKSQIQLQLISQAISQEEANASLNSKRLELIIKQATQFKTIKILFQKITTFLKQSTALSFSQIYNIYKSIMSHKNIYLSKEEIRLLPTIGSQNTKDIYVLMLIIYHYDMMFNQEKFLSKYRTVIQQTKIKQGNLGVLFNKNNSKQTIKDKFIYDINQFMSQIFSNPEYQSKWICQNMIPLKGQLSISSKLIKLLQNILFVW